MTTLPPEPGNGEQPNPAADSVAPPAAQQPPAAQEPPAAAPQYQAPPAAAPGYQAAPPAGGAVPPQGGYQQPGYAPAPAADPVNNITLNYWLSVFFTWLPALIFFLIEKDKGNQQSFAFHRENLNFSLLRTAAYIAIVVIGWIPYIGWLLAIVLWLGQIVLFVFHIMAAAKAPEAYRRGGGPEFVFNIPFIK